MTSLDELEPRTLALRDAYWAHREVVGRHRSECCQDSCFPDIVDRWVTLMVERSNLHDPHLIAAARREDRLRDIMAKMIRTTEDANIQQTLKAWREADAALDEARAIIAEGER